MFFYYVMVGLVLIFETFKLQAKVLHMIKVMTGQLFDGNWPNLGTSDHCGLSKMVPKINP